MNKKIKLCLYGPTGSGKTTLANYLVNKYNFELFKIAQPLHDFQKTFYSNFDIDSNGQDGELLQFLAEKIEKPFPGSLAKLFLKKISKSSHDLIINDDCRLNSYERLAEDGFIFIRIFTHDHIRLQRMRIDMTKCDINHSTEQGFNLFEYNHEIDNNRDIKFSFRQIDQLTKKLFELSNSKSILSYD